jgi:hypothetical protein
MKDAFRTGRAVGVTTEKNQSVKAQASCSKAHRN